MSILKYALALFSAVTLVPCFAQSSSWVPGHDEIGSNYNAQKPINPKQIVFIHGMFMTPKAWDAWAARFAAEGYDVSAPAWPIHDGSLDQLRSESSFGALGKLQLADVISKYRTLLIGMKIKPILIGHSMGGLVAQILLSEGLGSAAIAIDSAPPKGIINLSFPSVISNWGALNPFANLDSPIQMSLESFSYSFANAQSPDDQQRLYREFYVPESRRVGRGPLTRVARIDFSKPRGPLLIIAGGKDHTIPADLNYDNFKAYLKTPAHTVFQMFPERDHSTTVSPGWEAVADRIRNWIEFEFLEN